MNEYYFHLDHLTVGYDKKPLIKDICIGIEKGEIVTLIGPNGSGKSTILKSITRQLKLVGGNVEFDGKNLHELSFRELSTKMAVVLTERMKPELMTCHDIVATGRYPYTGRLGMLTREDEEKVEKAMRAVHAEELGGRYQRRPAPESASCACDLSGAGGHHPRRADFFPRYPPQAGTARDSAPHGKGEGHHRHHVAA